MSAGALVLASCGTGSKVGVKTLAPPAAVPAGPVHGKAGAQAYAGALLNALGLPPGSRLLAGAPPSALRAPQSRPSGPNLADRWRLVRVPGTASQLLAYLAGHRPKGFVSSSGGTFRSGSAGAAAATSHGRATGSSPSAVRWFGEQLQTPPAGAGLVELQVAAVASPGHSVVVRVDSLVNWLSPKPLAAQVSSRDSVVILTEDREVGGRPTTRRVVVTDPATVTRFRDAANGLEPAPSGTFSCPMMPAGPPEQVVIAFATAATAQPDVTFTVALTGCGRVAVTEHGQNVATLANDAALMAAYSAVLGQRPTGRHSPI